MNTYCGNARHPAGAWHPATPIAPSWRWWQSWRQSRRIRKWGCRCAV